MNFIRFQLIFIFLACFSVNSSAAITIYGLTDTKKLVNQPSATQQFALQLGAFKNKNNAERYIHSLEKKLGETIKLVHTDNSKQGLVAVVVGPANSNEILSVIDILQGKKNSKAAKSSLVKKMKVASKVSVPAKDALVTKQVTNDNNLSTGMNKNRKIEIHMDSSPEAIEARARQLYFESAKLDEQIKNSTTEEQTNRYKKQQAQVNQELEQLTQIVMKRVSHVG